MLISPALKAAHHCCSPVAALRAAHAGLGLGVAECTTPASPGGLGVGGVGTPPGGLVPLIHLQIPPHGTKGPAGLAPCFPAGRRACELRKGAGKPPGWPCFLPHCPLFPSLPSTAENCQVFTNFLTCEAPVFIQRQLTWSSG